MNRIFPKSILGFICLCFLFSSCKKDNGTVVHIDKEDFTIEDQSQIATNLASLIESSVGFYNILEEQESPEFYSYIKTILNSIVNTSMVENRNTFDWEVIILKDDNIRNAFAIPGGKIYIYTGLLKTISSENELFSILAHEVYYIEKEVLLEAMKAEYGSLVVGDLVVGTNSRGAIDIAETVYSLKYSKTQVLEADVFALELICPFQYEARGLKSFIEKASAMSEEVEWLINHPGDEDRLIAIEANAEACGIEELTFMERYQYQKNLLP